MEFGWFTYGTALTAGALSTLSPCVLPLVPILLTSAITAHRFGVMALAFGLTLSFTGIGVLVASVGVAAGFDAGIMRSIAAAVLLLLGIVLLSPAAQAWLATSTGGIANAGNRLLANIKLDGFSGQFAVGLLLGIVWTPCVGPTLGTAVTLASQGTNIAQVTLVMLLFGIGTAAPLIVLGTLSREAITRVRGKLMATGKHGKQFLGVALLLVAGLILTGADKVFEAWITDIAPAWWVELTTRL
jgi:cytochrome c-type biogenesis protein